MINSFIKYKRIFLLFLCSIISILFYRFIYIMLNRKNEITCFSNQRKLGEAINLYSHDYDDALPNRNAWENYLPGINSEIYCPSASKKVYGVEKTGFYGYAFNENVFEIKKNVISYPNSTVVVFESAAGILSSNAPQPFATINPDELSLEKGWLRHHGGSHYLFADGHVRWYRENEVKGTDDYDGNDGLRPTFNVFLGIKQQRQHQR